MLFKVTSAELKMARIEAKSVARLYNMVLVPVVIKSEGLSVTCGTDKGQPDVLYDGARQDGATLPSLSSYLLYYDIIITTGKLMKGRVSQFVPASSWRSTSSPGTYPST